MSFKSSNSFQNCSKAESAPHATFIRSLLNKECFSNLIKRQHIVPMFRVEKVNKIITTYGIKVQTIAWLIFTYELIKVRFKEDVNGGFLWKDQAEHLDRLICNLVLNL